MSTLTQRHGRARPTHHLANAQVQDGLPGQLPAYRGTLDAARTMLRLEGWQGLYAGLAPSLLGSTVAWGTYLYLYEQIKAWHRQRQGIGGHAAASAASSKGSGTKRGSKQQQQQQQAVEPPARLSAAWNLLSAAQAGAIVCVLTNPIWLVKTRLALQQRSHQAAAAAAGAAALKAGGASSGGAYRGMLDALARIGREEGLRGYYKGFGPSLLLQTTHGAIQFAAYEECKHLAARAGRPAGAPDRQLTSAEVSVYGAASKFLAAGAQLRVCVCVCVRVCARARALLWALLSVLAGLRFMCACACDARLGVLLTPAACAPRRAASASSVRAQCPPTPRRSCALACSSAPRGARSCTAPRGRRRLSRGSARASWASTRACCPACCV
jgi:hypothetical protein